MASMRVSIDPTHKWQAFVDIENQKKLDQMNAWLRKALRDEKWKWRLMSKTNEFCPLFSNKEDAVLFFLTWK